MNELSRKFKIVLLILGAIIAALMWFTWPVYAQTTVLVPSGGTGTTSIPAGYYLIGSTTARATATSSGLFNNLKVSGSATSSFANGLNLSGGCYAINGECFSGGGAGVGTVNSGSAGQVAYYAGSGSAVSGTSSITLNTGNVQIGGNYISLLGNVGVSTSTTPANALVVGGNQRIQLGNYGCITMSGSGQFRLKGGDCSADAQLIITALFANGIYNSNGQYFAQFGSTNGSMTLSGGHSSGVNGAYLQLYGSTHSTLPSRAVLTAQRFGIGTTTPSAQLSASTTNEVGLMLDQRGSLDLINLLANGVRVLTVKASGYLGIGTSTPAALFAGDNGATTDNLLLLNNGTPYTNGYFKVSRYGEGMFKDRYDTKEASYVSGWGIMERSATSSSYTVQSVDNDGPKIAGSLERVYGRGNNTFYIEADYSLVDCGAARPSASIVLATTNTGTSNANGVMTSGTCSASNSDSSGTLRCLAWAGPSGVTWTPGYSLYINWVVDSDIEVGCEARMTRYKVQQN